jgi:hypothetical protein
MQLFTALTLVCVLLSLGFCRPVVTIEKPSETKTEIFIKFNNK